MKIIVNLCSCGTCSTNVFPLHQKHAERVSFTHHIDEMALAVINYFLWKTKAHLQTKHKLELADLASQPQAAMRPISTAAQDNHINSVTELLYM